ncbi:DNA polymerase III subunit tau [Slackia heliotrinireducens]|uniref:DNA-directed DNA polymerase n=1 Tax=Slackia heliotrinireducens (strain ATCC 29202 / DSM 20476 / NCTC 11029 / RHS 1) TaxID=471855 RepID=C7N1K9_SLAHD|nr:DNA polymerase III subunit gamma/tau [Slackia heliotrinireducens]ACV21301.1 DNA polymerase III, subunit gamma/tau [Slackia heliotrinireducens DSM 20476]VEG98736.1 DNA polymerase III subunit tau [Slackia heliotrinireducens]
MAEALYRKYRPQTFDDVVGQTHVERTLKNALQQDHVSHAYLFCGPRGTGKTTMARLLAKALLCEHGPTPSPDGTCEECQLIAEGAHPDVNELDAASRTGVDNVREEIIGRVQFAPTRGRYKIYIIDEVHMLTVPAFNALLKTLEEPPAHVVFVMCTTDPQKIPETILSRCQRFDFHRLSNEEIVSRLGAVCMAEDVPFEGEALDLIARRAQGGMRDALTALEQLIAFGAGNVTMDVANAALGSLDVNDMSEIAGHIGRRDAAACFTWMAEYVETGADLAQFARDLASYVRDMYVFSLTDGAVGLSSASSSNQQQLAEDAKLYGTDRLAYILDVLGDLNTSLRSSTNPRLSFEIALTRMVRPQSDLTLEALAARIEVLEKALASGQFAAPAGTTPAAAAPVPASVPASQSGYAGQAVPAKPARDEVPAPSRAQEAAARMRAARSQQAAPQPRPQAQPAPQAQPRPMAQPQAQPAPQAQATPQPAVQPQVQARPASQAQPRPQAPAAAAAPADLAAKLTNPAALQRGWQAAVAEVKRERSIYGALLMSANVVSEVDGSAMRIEFSSENTMAFNMVQKPDVTETIASALGHAFGMQVPFKIVQNESMAPVAPASPFPSAPAPQPAPAPAPAPTPAPAPAPAPAPQPAPATDPGSDDDVVPYDDADASYYAGDYADEAPVDLDITAAAPVDSVAAGRKLGFDVDKSPQSSYKPIEGWPMPNKTGKAKAAKSAPAKPASSAMPKPQHAVVKPPVPKPVPAPQPAPAPQPQPIPSPEPEPPRIPVAQVDEPAADIADIFGAFGVSFEDVQETN